MARFRKKPVEIEAFQWTADRHQSEDPTWIIDAITSQRARFCGTGTALTMLIETDQGTATARLDDWIIQQIDGELYPCKPHIFAATYEQVVSVAPEVDG